MPLGIFKAGGAEALATIEAGDQFGFRCLLPAKGALLPSAGAFEVKMFQPWLGQMMGEGDFLIEHACSWDKN